MSFVARFLVELLSLKHLLWHLQRQQSKSREWNVWTFGKGMG